MIKHRHDEAVRFFSTPDMQYVRAVSGAGVTNDFSRHVHRTFIIGTVLKGTRIISQGAASTSIPEGCLFLLNPGFSHTCRSQGKAGHSYLALCVQAEYLRRIASQISGSREQVPYFKKVLIRDQSLSSDIRSFFSLLADADSLLARETLLYSILSKLILKYGQFPPVPSKPNSRHEGISRAVEFTKNNYRKNVTLEQLSKVACISPFHLERMFLKKQGVSPHEFLVQCRIRHAETLLLKGHSIVCVSLDTGFFDQSHFSRAFRKIVGIPPGRYRELHKETAQ